MAFNYGSYGRIAESLLSGAIISYRMNEFTIVSVKCAKCIENSLKHYISTKLNSMDSFTKNNDLQDLLSLVDLPIFKQYQDEILLLSKVDIYEDKTREDATQAIILAERIIDYVKNI